nr:reverse transcriptase domain-containing protein [Tanacetum cinerariifolium]
MSTRSSTRNLFPPLDNPKLTIRRRSRADPTLLNDFEMAAEGNGDLPVPDLRTIEELCQPSLNGRGRPITPISIQAINFRLKNDMIQKVQNSCQFHGLPENGQNVSGKYFPPSMVTKLRNKITNFRQHPDESLFEAWERYKLSIDRCPNHNMLPVTQIDTFYNGLTLRYRDTINAAAGGTFMKMCPKECYDLIENITAHHNDWDTSAQRSESSISITSSFDTKIAALKAEMGKINKNLMRVLEVNQQVKAVTPNCEICGGPHSFNDCPTTVGNTQNVYAAGAYQGNTVTNPKEELKGITTRSGTSYQEPTIPTTSFSLPPVVERETEATKDTVHPTNNESIKDVQPPIVQTESSTLNSDPVVAAISAPKPNQRPSIPYPSKLHDQKLRDKANDQREIFFQIFKDLYFNISFADALILMPKFGPTIKSLLTNKDKLSELARTPLNEHCSAVLLKKLPEKLGELGKFLIPCDFPGMDECLALADLDASINLMPLSVWNKLPLHDLSPTCMTLELFDRSITRPLGSPKMSSSKRPLIDVFEGELTLREYSQEFLGFSDVIASGNPNPYYDPIVSTTSPTLTPFERILGQRQEKHFRPRHYASKTMTEAESNYTTTEKEMLAVVYAFEKILFYLIMNKSIMYTDHSALKYLFAKKASKARLLRWVLLLQEFTYKVIDTKGAANLAADHLSRLENPHQNVLDPKEINESFPLETLNMVSFHGPFSSSQGNKYILVAVDNLSKWVEEKALPTTDARVVEVSNRGLKQILERTVSENRASWSDKLDDALWAFRTAYKTPIGCNPYKLVYGKACHLSIELEHKAYYALKHVNFDLQTVGDHIKVQLNELNELRDQAYENSLIYKEKTKRLHDLKIKDRVFNIGDRVLFFNSRLKIFASKSKSRWSGPFTISHVFPYGTVELS